jgi:hypothetical protein
MLVLGAVGALCAGEVAIRILIFHPDLCPRALSQKFREAQRYAEGNNDDDYWKLTCLLQGESALTDAPNPDPITGWTGPFITPGTYEHCDEPSIGSRRPVILYGDSFAQCGTGPSECFQSILERSELGTQYALMNYGVGGYGLDQIYLLLHNSIDRFAQRNPIVIVGILVDSDLERSVLEFRCWPKPRLDVVGTRLVARGPVETSTREFLAQHPVGIASYLWRFLLYQRGSFLAGARAHWRGEERIKAEKQILNRTLLHEIENELSSRHLEHFYLVFHSELGALRHWDDFAWQEQMIEDVCAERGAMLVDTRPYLAFASKDRDKNCARFYGHGSPLQGHHNALGNLVCFEAIRRGLLRESGPCDMRHLEGLELQGLLEAAPAEVTSAVFLGRNATLITHGSQGSPRAVQTSDPDRFLLRADSTGATVTKFELAGGEKRFTGVLHTVAGAEQGCPEQGLRFTVEVDGLAVLECDAPPLANARSIDIDLAGKRSLAITVAGDRGGMGCAWLCIEHPRLE